MAVFLFRLQTHPSLIDSTCFGDWCPFSPFPSRLNLCFEFKNLDITTPTGSWESAQEMGINPHPDSQQPSGTFPLASVTPLP